MDYKRFLARAEVVVLPHLGGTLVEAHARAPRLDAPVAEGWWRFEIEGRVARALEASSEDREVLDALEAVRGHHLRGRVVSAGAASDALHLLPADEPPRFAPITGRRLPSGAVVFDRLELESGVEEEARAALDAGASLAAVKGAPATLRAAFGYAVAEQVAARLDVPFAHVELRRAVLDLAEREDGRAVAEQALFRLRVERLTARTAAPAPGAARVGAAGAEVRAETALRSTGAALLDLRRLEGGLLEVTWRFMGERFQSVVRQDTLRVVDAGVCLAGADGLVTLESLPAVVREAIHEGDLVITRRAP